MGSLRGRTEKEDARLKKEEDKLTSIFHNRLSSERDRLQNIVTARTKVEGVQLVENKILKGRRKNYVVSCKVQDTKHHDGTKSVALTSISNLSLVNTLYVAIEQAFSLSPGAAGEDEGKSKGWDQEEGSNPSREEAPGHRNEGQDGPDEG